MKLLLDKWQPTKRLGKIIKRRLNVVLLILLLTFIVTPFLRLDGGWKEVFKWMWIGIAILHLDHLAEYKKAREEKIITPTFSAFLLLLSVYLANYWSLIPLSAGIVVPLVVGTLEVAISICIYKAIRFTHKQALILQPAKVTTAILLGSVYASAVSLFVLGHFLSETMIFVFGIIAMIMLFSSVISVISKGFSASKSIVSTIGIILDIVSVLALIGYLIYLTPNEDGLQDIVLSLTSAVIGGAVTLAGVAWTIKHQAESNQMEEKKKYRPFLVARESRIEYNEKFVGKVETNLMFSSPRVENTDFIVMFTLKNPTEHPICITGIRYSDEPYHLHQNAHYYIDSKSEVQINIFTSKEEAKKIHTDTTVMFELSDVLGNMYHNILLIKDSLIVSTILEEVEV